MKKLTSAYQNAVTNSTRVFSNTSPFWRRPRLAVHVTHSVVLPSGSTAAKLTVYGWGWLRVRAATAPRQVPVARRFIWGKAVTLDLTVPVATRVTVIATNLWGRIRTDFDVAATHEATPALPQSARVRSMPAMSSSSLHVPEARVNLELSKRGRVNAARLRPNRSRSGRLPSQFGAPAFVGALSRMSTNLRLAVDQIDRVTTNIESEAEEH